MEFMSKSDAIVFGINRVLMECSFEFKWVPDFSDIGWHYNTNIYHENDLGEDLVLKSPVELVDEIMNAKSSDTLTMMMHKIPHRNGYALYFNW